MDYSRVASSSRRPTLPPLHTLDLPIPASRTGPAHVYDDSDDYKPCRLLQNTWIHRRQASISSSSSTTSRSPSPIISATTRPPPSPLPTRLGMAHANAHADLPVKVRLVPCSFESADAYVYVPPPPPSSSSVSQKVSDTIQGQRHESQPLLLVGSAAKQLREPNRKIVKGARVHPYRIVPTARTFFRPPRKLL